MKKPLLSLGGPEARGEGPGEREISRSTLKWVALPGFAIGIGLLGKQESVHQQPHLLKNINFLTVWLQICIMETNT
ncbi:MAG: hypothetical protein EAZ78_01235 [Oscillatoriales cyanobacterium]|nr:MAG: hypothetical protein EAZ78_01235 [Oscillatoriales cyanobacterium]TAF47210.1 MAG: hypothetical protein EAZ68_02295 [Oscillatoriales cyanobacterium]TAF71471.1 MAG: hypothetical protein EAZ59_00705 [Oscillatoriales cyanobacterium]